MDADASYEAALSFSRQKPKSEDQICEEEQKED